jgi:hypothetical protein
MNGVVMHTEVSPSDAGVIKFFNEDTAGASATFSINQAGHVHQFGPLGKGWYAWAQMAGNRTWYSVECEDRGNPNTPLTDAQIIAFAQLVELLSRFAGFPMQIANSPSEHGFGVHYMGGKDWGGHTCPDLPPQHVRSHQRQAILDLAHEIRNAKEERVPEPVRHEADGTKSLDEVADHRNTTAEHIITVTRRSKEITRAHELLFENYVKSGTNRKMPNGLVYYTSH